MLLEIFAGGLMLTLCASARGWFVMQPVEIGHGLDLYDRGVQRRVDAAIERDDPDLVVAAPPCTAHSPLQRLGLGKGWKRRLRLWELKQKRRQVAPHWRLTEEKMLQLKRRNRDVCMVDVTGLGLWKIPSCPKLGESIVSLAPTRR